MAKLVTVRFEDDKEANFFIEYVKQRGEVKIIYPILAYVKCTIKKVQSEEGISTPLAREIVKRIAINGQSISSTAKELGVGITTVHELVYGIRRKEEVEDILLQYPVEKKYNLNRKKFTDDQVRYIRSCGKTSKEIAAELSSSINSINKVRQGKKYKNVT